MSPYWKLSASGSYLIPNTESLMSWQIGDNSFYMGLSPKLPEIISNNLKTWLELWLKGSGFDLADIKSWAVHPGGTKILNAVEHSLNLSKQDLRASREILAEYGNMSSATLLFVLKKLQTEKFRPPCVVLGFGPGIVAEALLLV